MATFFEVTWAMTLRLKIRNSCLIFKKRDRIEISLKKLLRFNFEISTAYFY